jgi:hypothetical protein
MRSMACLLLLTLLSGGGAHAEREVSFSEEVLPLLMRECAYCHMREERYGYLVFEPETAYGNLVGVPARGYPAMQRVEPGAPDRSYLWMKMTGKYLDLGGEGWRMPLFPMAESKMDTVRLWIEQGAPNN